MSKTLLFIICASCISVHWGCRTPKPVEKKLPASSPEYAEPPVVLGPGDVLEVRFLYTPELNVTQVVRPDGKIALQMIGEVTVQGKTPAQLKDDLLEQYADQLKDPEIVVLVQSLYARSVFVGGQVVRPSMIEMPTQMTAMEAIMRAGGFDWREAEAGSVLVLRHEGNRWKGYKLNLKSAIEGSPTDCFFLKPKDIVHVPRSDIAKVDQWIEQHINKVIPDVLYIRIPIGDDDDS
ncbi:MAG: polysaccharide biosynthesis/export family protein [Sedimentisphaerales bacterium]|nr:polysaccharide biosynthesis/export family protein [Sedimentisphaerales bacterium]